MRLIPRVAGTAVASAALLLSTGIAAHAQSETVKDKSSDVIRYADQTDEQGTVLGYTESVDSGLDLRSMQVKHTKKSVSVKLKFAKLNAGTTVYVGFRADGKKTPSRVLVGIDKKFALVMNARGDIRCQAPLTTRLGKNGSIRAVVKRSCLGTPKKIKVSAAATDDQALEENVPYLGDTLSPTAVCGEAWTKWLKAS